jgi:hypothetical protein
VSGHEFIRAAFNNNRDLLRVTLLKRRAIISRRLGATLILLSVNLCQREFIYAAAILIYRGFVATKIFTSGAEALDVFATTCGTAEAVPFQINTTQNALPAKRPCVGTISLPIPKS